MRKREFVGWAAIATAALIFSVAAPSFGQNGGTPNAGKDNGVGQGIIPPPPRGVPNPGQGQGKGRGRAKRGPSRPTPHGPDGHVLLGPLPGEGGVWNGGAGSTLFNSGRGGIDNALTNAPVNLKVEDVPFQDWARALYESRRANNTADDPHVRCKSSGGPRLFHTPYGFEIVDIPELERIYIMGVGGPHTYRTIYMDGRERPKDIDPSFHGYSIGHWEGEKLVVETTNYNQRFWISREGPPTTELLKMTETFERPEYDTLRYIATIDDPGAYTAKWSGGWAIPWNANDEMYEYICQENNRDAKHMFRGEQ